MALYVYGIVESGSLTDQLPGAGIDAGHAPRLVEVGELAAVVSDVDVSQFEGDALERNVATPEWLETKVRAHESVLDEILAQATVIPMRFGSIFSSRDGLEEMLGEHSTALRSALDRVHGRSEWGVKIHCDRAAVTEQLATTGSGNPGSGRDYLMQKKARLDAQARMSEMAASVAAEAHDSLSGVSDAANTVSSNVGASSDAVVLNGAYLVRDEDRERFMQQVETLQARFGEAYIFVVTGPWPPYNFSSADVAGPVV